MNLYFLTTSKTIQLHQYKTIIWYKTSILITKVIQNYLYWIDLSHILYGINDLYIILLLNNKSLKDVYIKYKETI